LLLALNKLLNCYLKFSFTAEQHPHNTFLWIPLIALRPFIFAFSPAPLLAFSLRLAHQGFVSFLCVFSKGRSALLSKTIWKACLERDFASQAILPYHCQT